MTISLTSPNVDNLYVGKGIVSVKFTTDTDFVDMGNVVSLETTLKVTKLDHFSERYGTKKKDLTVATIVEATLKMVAEEMTARNLAMALMADINDSGGVVTLDIGVLPLRSCQIKFVGTNDVGPQWSLLFPHARLSPSAAFNPISDEWGKVELDGDILVDPITNSFGTATATFPP